MVRLCACRHSEPFTPCEISLPGWRGLRGFSSQHSFFHSWLTESPIHASPLTIAFQGLVAHVRLLEEKRNRNQKGTKDSHAVPPSDKRLIQFPTGTRACQITMVPIGPYGDRPVKGKRSASVDLRAMMRLETRWTSLGRHFVLSRSKPMPEGLIVSACLLGRSCRYDGQSKPNAEARRLAATTRATRTPRRRSAGRM